jgi:SPFH domain / Band 7 family
MNANQAEEPSPAVRVTMSDRSVCTVSLSVQIRILPENTPKVVVALGSADEIRPFLKPVVESAVVTPLSGKTFRQISKESIEVSAELVWFAKITDPKMRSAYRCPSI